MKPLPDLLPGDLLGYRPSSLFGYITAFKTWCKVVTHVSVYADKGNSVASRNGKGVNIYPLRTDDLSVVLRPKKNPDMDTAMAWFYSKACGQKYDVAGLFCFYLAVKQGSPKKMFCSEFATRFYRQAKLIPFNPNYDADRVSPAQFLQSPAFEEIWRDD